MASKKPETVFKERVQKFLDKICYFHEKTQQATIRGTPDILMSVCGIFIGIELKRSMYDKADSLQEYKLQRIKKAGGLSYTVYPENFQQFKQQLYLDLATYKYVPPLSDFSNF